MFVGVFYLYVHDERAEKPFKWRPQYTRFGFGFGFEYRRETKAKIKCDLIKTYVIFFTDYVVCFCVKENVEFHYNRLWFLLSLLARYSKERFKRPAAVTKTDYRTGFRTLTSDAVRLSSSSSSSRLFCITFRDKKLMASNWWHPSCMLGNIT